MPPEISLVAEPLFHIGSLAVTNSLLLSTITMVAIVSALYVVAGKKLAMVPTGLQNGLEIVVEGLVDTINSVVHDRKKSETYLPLIASIFLFVLISNWLGLLPGVGTFLFREGHEGARGIPLLRAPAADLNFTLALAVIAVVATHILGVGAIGVRTHVTKFLNFHGPIEFFVGVLELVSEFAKMVSFSFRLFGNVFAGEVLLTIVAFLVPYVVPLPFLFLELFVGFVQALIFSMLTLVFIATATTNAH